MTENTTLKEKESKVRKKNKTLFKSTVRNKLIAISMIAIVLPLALLGFFSYQKSFEVLEEKLAITTEQTIGEINKAITLYLEGIESQTKVLADNSSFKQLYIDALSGATNLGNASTFELLRSTKENNANIINTYFATELGGMYLYPTQDLPEGYDPRTRGWYKDAINKTDSVIWTEPYTDATSGQVTITAAKAVIENGKVIGVAAIDVDLKNISEDLGSRTIGREGYVYATDKNGIMLAHPDGSLIGSDTVQKLSYWNEVKSKGTGFTEYVFEGKNKFVSYATNEKTGWKFMAAMDEKELLTDTDIIKKFTMYSLIFGVLLAQAVSFLIASSISKPLTVLKDTFTRASLGDLTTRARIASKDEFGEIGRSFNSMMENITLLITDVKNSAMTVLEMSNSLADITEQTTVATDEVAKTIEDVAKSAGEQARDTEQGAMKMSDLADSIERVATATAQMNQISKDANALSSKGLKTVELLIEKSSESKTASMEVSEIVLRVDKSAEEIGAITDTIGQIAEQTNLLALNAAIEAARAGDSGRGFAVVADEVRKLAEESSKSAENIRKLISGIQKQSKTAVNAMDQTKEIIREQDEAAKETENIFNHISNAITTLIIKVAEVQDDSDDMAVKKNEIIDVIGNISAVAQQTSAATQEVSASTEEQLASMEEIASHTQDLSSLATKLEEVVGKFKTESDRNDLL